jgi:hypothetical protein
MDDVVTKTSDIPSAEDKGGIAFVGAPSTPKVMPRMPRVRTKGRIFAERDMVDLLGKAAKP